MATDFVLFAVCCHDEPMSGEASMEDHDDDAMDHISRNDRTDIADDEDGGNVAARLDEEDQVDLRPRKRPRRSTTSVDNPGQQLSRAQVEDMRELVEHLVIVGNHHRHQNWRRKRYKKKRVASSRKRGEDDDEDLSESDKAQNHSDDEEISANSDDDSEAKSQSLLLNAEDTRL